MLNLCFLALALTGLLALPEFEPLHNVSVPMEATQKIISRRKNTDDTTFLLNGKISGQKKGYIKLIYTDRNGKYILDSSAISKGRFRFRGHITEPTMVYLEGDVKIKDMNDPNFTSFFLEPADISIVLVYNDFKNAVIKGSKTHDEFKELNKIIAPIIKETELLSKEYDVVTKEYRQAVKAKKDEVVIESLEVKIEEIRRKFEPYSLEIRKKEYDFFMKYPQSYVTAFQLRFHVSYMALDSLQYFYNNLGDMIQQSAAGKEIAKEIEKLAWGSPGRIAKDFTTTDLEGNKLSLSDYKGKYVLLDFWASWCVPCRKGNPHLKELYAMYKDRGIEFIGIADDDQAEDKWKEAIVKDGIDIWKHVLRGLKYRNNVYDQSNDISEKFGIHSLPTKILIDPQGKIIGRYSEEEDSLDEMLKKIFGQ